MPKFSSSLPISNNFKKDHRTMKITYITGIQPQKIISRIYIILTNQHLSHILRKAIRYPSTSSPVILVTRIIKCKT